MITRRQFTVSAGSGVICGALGRIGCAPAEAAAGDGLGREFARIEEALKARLGVAVLDTATGRVVSHRGDERFPMCSTFKVLACGAVLARVDAGHEDLDRRIRFTTADLVPYSPVTKERVGGDGMTLGEICAAGITRSDNTAANMILASLGGPPAVTAFARSIGDEVTRLDRTETTLNEATPGDPRDTTSPNAMATDLQTLVLGNRLTPRSRQQLADWLVANQTGGAKLRAGLPPDWRVGDKTGSGDFGTTNDVAVIWPPSRQPLVVCVYVTETTASSEASNAAIAAVGRAVRIAVAG